MTNPSTPNYRTIGDTTEAVWRAELERLGSPWTDRATTLRAAASPHSALCLAMGVVENRWGATGIIIKPADNNPLSLRPWEEDPRGAPQGSAGVITASDGGMFLRFETPEDCIREWKRRLVDDPDYKNGVYTSAVSIEDMIDIYAPPGDVHPESGLDNVDIGYARTVRDLLTRYAGQEPATDEEKTTMATFTTKIPGLPQPAITSFPVHVRLVPESVANVRPGIQASTPRRWVQHETGNPNSFAAGENKYLRDGAEGRQASYHFAGDDTEVFVNIPLNEVTWQAADGGGPGNMNGVSYELCVATSILSDPARKQRSREIAAEMFGVVAAQLGIDKPEQHWDFNFNNKPEHRHHCPDNMRKEEFWEQFVEMGMKFKGLAAGQAVREAVEEITSTLDYPDGMDAGIAAIAFGKVTGTDGVAYAFNESGPVSQLWLSEGMKSKQFPQLTSAHMFDDRKYFIFSNGMVIWQPQLEAPVAVLG